MSAEGKTFPERFNRVANSDAKEEITGMSKRLFVISQFYAEETGTGLSMTKNAEGLAKHFPVTVLCGQPNYLKSNNRAPAKERVNGVDIRRSRSTPFTNKALLPKLINMLTISVTIFFSALNKIKADDAVLIVNLPPLSGFSHRLAANTF